MWWPIACCAPLLAAGAAVAAVQGRRYGWRTAFPSIAVPVAVAVVLAALTVLLKGDL